MDFPRAPLEPTDWLLADTGTFEDAAPSELQQEADAYAANAQAFSAAPAAATPPSSSSSTLLQQQQQQQQQSNDTLAASGFVPVDELPTFELPNDVEWQHDREAAAGAASAAATMSALQQFAAEDVSMHLDHDDQQPPQQTLQTGAAAASANGHGSSKFAHTAAASSAVDPGHCAAWGQQQPRFAAVAAAAAAAAAAAGSTAASHLGPRSAASEANDVSSAVQLLPHIDEAAASALQSVLQQQDDKQLMQEAAAVSTAPAAASDAGFGAVGGGGFVQLSGYGLAEGAADDAGLGMPDLSTGEVWRDLTAVTQFQQLDLQDEAQQQQQQQQPLVPPGLQQQYQPQAGQFHRQLQPQQQQQRDLHGELDLNELLQAGGGSAVGTDREDWMIPVLQQPHPQQPLHDTAQVVLPPGQRQQQRQSGVGILEGFEGLSGGAEVEAEEGIGPHMFGLPVEAAPALPDEPVQLLKVPENVSDSYLL